MLFSKHQAACSQVGILLQKEQSYPVHDIVHMMLFIHAKTTLGLYTRQLVTGSSTW